MNEIEYNNIINNNLAFAQLFGSSKYPYLFGIVNFSQLRNGVLVTVEVRGLPFDNNECGNNIYGFHIHEGMECSGTSEEPFLNAKTHFSKNKCKHPYHSGDMPPLFGNNGYAYMSFLTNRFYLKDIVGRVVIIHRNFDDLKTEPGGNSGEKIACGKIYMV